MKTMIIYASKTGHTERIARSMGEQLGVTPKNIKDKPIIENIDLLFIGSGVYGGKDSPELIQFLDTLNKNSVQNVVLFSTCTSGENSMIDVKEVLITKGIHVNEKTFVCKGKFLLFSRKHPDDVDLQNAKIFASEIAKQYIERN